MARVEVSAGDWATDPARVYPLRIDPPVTVFKFSSPADGGKDTFVWSTAPTLVAGSSAGLYVGVNTNGTLRSLVAFNLGVAPASNIYVTSAAVVLNQQSAGTCAATPMYLNSIASNWTEAGTWWNNMPTVAADTVTAPAFNKGPAGCSTPGYGTPIYLTAMVERWLSGVTPNYGMQLSSAAETNAAYNKDFASGNTAAAPYLVFTFGHRPAIAAPASPAHGTRVDTTTPTLATAAAIDPDGDTVSYWFKGTSGTDAVTGHLAIESGWQPGTTFQVPPGLLVDGVSYTWNVYTWDSYGGTSAVTLPDPTLNRSFTVDLHLGAEPAAPYDAMGPVQVNLVSGNALVSAASPAGLSYAYNSSTPTVTGAAIGSYYNDFDADGGIDANELVMERRDPTIGMYWGLGGPGGGVWADNFMVRWSAKLKVPTAGSYKFFVSADDGIKLTVQGTGSPVVLDRWSGGAALPGVYSDPIAATTGEKLTLTVDYKEATSISYANVWVEGPGTPPTPKLAPLDPSWLEADTPALPTGWTLSPGLAYASARVVDDHVVLTDASGAPHVYSGKAGGYLPPPEEDAVLGLDVNGSRSLQGADGTTYGFDGGGHISSATVATDDGAPSSRTYLYSTIDGQTRLAEITDPVGGRTMYLHYQDFDPAKGCPSPGTGFVTPPPQALCQVDYWDPDAVTTVLQYVSEGLAQIEDPGAVASPAIATSVAGPAPVTTDFSYSGNKMTSIRSPLANDALRAGVVTDVSGKARTVIAYPVDKVGSVTLPVPNSGAVVELPRTVHTYAYGTGSATVTVTGLSGVNRSVGFDALGRTLTDTQTTGANPSLVTTMVWDDDDNLVSFTDPADRRTTTSYDGDAVRAHASGRATQSYGPAPADDCYSGDTPTCLTTMPHSVTAYDSDTASATTAWPGLAATYWDNRTLAGGSVVGVRDGPTAHDVAALSSGSPLPSLPAGLPANNWSARYTGELDVTSAGAHGFALILNGGGRLFVDDVLVIDATGNLASRTVNSPAPPSLGVGRHRIRLDYETPTADIDPTPALALHWAPPVGSAGAVPATSVAPRYSMATATTVDDQPTANATRVSGTTYGRLAAGTAAFIPKAARLTSSATADVGGAPDEQGDLRGRGPPAAPGQLPAGGGCQRHRHQLHVVGADRHRRGLHQRSRRTGRCPAHPHPARPGRRAPPGGELRLRLGRAGHQARDRRRQHLHHLRRSGPGAHRCLSCPHQHQRHPQRHRPGSHRHLRLRGGRIRDRR